MPWIMAKRKEQKTERFWPYGLAIFAIILLLDQLTKRFIVTNYALGESHRMLPGFWFTYVQNTGTNWGILNGSSYNWVFIWLSVIAFGLLLYFFDAFKTVPEKIGYALLLAGLWGNLIDRATLGFVVDFIDLHWWPVFNIADSAICVAVVILLLEQWRNR
jgi:signal peptidase II